MVSRGVAYLCVAPLSVPKNPAAKSRVSITYKLIESKGLQVHCFGHLRKTGGRGSYRLVHATRFSLCILSSRISSKSLVSPTCKILAGNSFLSPTYAKTGGGYPQKNVGAPTFLIFPLIFRRLSPFKNAKEKFEDRGDGPNPHPWTPQGCGTQIRLSASWVRCLLRCRASGACVYLGVRTQPLRAGLSSGTPPAFFEVEKRTSKPAPLKTARVRHPSSF